MCTTQTNELATPPHPTPSHPSPLAKACPLLRRSAALQSTQPALQRLQAASTLGKQKLSKPAAGSQTPYPLLSALMRWRLMYGAGAAVSA